jgi:hypothetical protein
MGLKQATVKLGVDLSQFNTGLKKAQKSLRKVGKSMQNVGKGMSVGLTAPLTAFAAASVKAFDTQAKAEAKLMTALKGNEEAYKSLTAQARELQKVTIFGDEETIAAQSMLASMGLEEEAIKRLTPLIQDMATAKGMSLAGAADLVAKSVGSSTNALSRYGIQIEGAVGSTDRLDSAVNALSSQFEGQAMAAAQAGAGPLQQLKNSFGDLMEVIGEALVPVLKTLTDKAQSIVSWFLNLDGGTKRIIITIGGVLAVLGPVVALFGTLATVVAAVISPIGLAVAAIAGLVAAFLYVRDNWEAFKERLGDWSWWKNALIQALQWLVEYNPLSLVIKGFNKVLEFFGKNPIPNPYENIADGLEELKGETKEYEHQFKSFGDSMKSQAKEIAGAFGNLGASMGVGSGTPSTPKTRQKVETATVSTKTIDSVGSTDVGGQLQGGRMADLPLQGMDAVASKMGNLSEMVLSFADQFGGVFGQVFDFIGQNIDNQMTKLDNYYNKEAERIANSKKTEEQKQKALEKLDEKVAKKKAALQRKQAIADKARAMFEATINVAAQVAASIANPVMAAIVAGLGAAQIATIAAAPIPAFAQGGLVFGPTMGLVGEGIGTTRSNPEVIAPLDKLSQFIGGGQQNIVVTGRLDGTDILLSSKQTLINSRRVR